MFETTVESQLTKVFLTKVCDFYENKFFSVSMRPTFQLIVSVGGEAILIDGVCLGEIKNKQVYYNSLFKTMIQKSKLVDLEGNYFNPFEINSISP